ncbi:hypothetical protein [Halomonas sp. I5-271120]|uniref:hypothetical protein n=1 Tax=Halomonas sp. I5-271120 TaxID=3061632 RepID=UPI0027154790|nr:hypothetical protein [Halomonas sp. I5-271120]
MAMKLRDKWREILKDGEPHHTSELMQMITLALMASAWLFWRQGDGFWMLHHMLAVGVTFTALAVAAVMLDSDHGQGWHDPEIPFTRGGFLAMGIAFWLLANVLTLVTFMAVWMFQPNVAKLAFQFNIELPGYLYMAMVAGGYSSVRLILTTGLIAGKSVIDKLFSRNGMEVTY